MGIEANATLHGGTLFAVCQGGNSMAARTGRDASLEPDVPRPGETDEPKQPGQEREQDDDRAGHGPKQAFWLSS